MLIKEKRHCGKNLVEETLKENGVAGARLMSGGFGGCSINLIEDDSGINRVICFSENHSLSLSEWKWTTSKKLSAFGSNNMRNWVLKSTSTTFRYLKTKDV